MSLSIGRDGGQTVYVIEEDVVKKPVGKMSIRKVGAFPKVEAWWTKSGKGDSFLIRQHNTKERVDVLELSLGQAYDLLGALNHALGLPVGGRRALS